MNSALRLAMLLSLISCGDKNSDDQGGGSASASAKLSLAELAKPPILPALSKKDSAEFALSFSTSSKNAALALRFDEASVTSDCADEALAAMTISTSKDEIIVDGSTDLVACLKRGFSGPQGVVVNSGNLRYFSYTQCVGTSSNLASLNGRKLIEYNGGFDESCAGTLRYMSNYSLKISLTSRITGEDIEGNFEVINAESTAENEPCTSTLANGVRSENGCVSISKFVNNVDNSDNFYSKMISRDLTWNNLNPGSYYETGTIEYFANDWTGTYTYVGSANPPTFTASNGMENVTNADW